MEFPAVKYVHLLPNSFSDLEKLRCSIFLASEQGRLWLTHFMLQWKYDMVQEKLSFSADFIEDSMSHFVQAVCIQKNTCLHDVAEGLKNDCWLWCGLWYHEKNFPAWIYGVDEENKKIHLFRCTPDGLKQGALSLNDFNSSLFCGVDKIELLSFSTDKSLAKFSPIFLQAQIQFFLDSMDLSCLEKHSQNLSWGIIALQNCLQKAMLSQANVQVLYDHLNFMNYRIQLWKQFFLCDTALIEDAHHKLANCLQQLQIDFSTKNKQVYLDEIKNFYEHLIKFTEGVFICDCL